MSKSAKDNFWRVIASISCSLKLYRHVAKHTFREELTSGNLSTYPSLDKRGSCEGSCTSTRNSWQVHSLACSPGSWTTNDAFGCIMSYWTDFRRATFSVIKECCGRTWDFSKAGRKKQNTPQPVSLVVDTKRTRLEREIAIVSGGDSGHCRHSCFFLYTFFAIIGWLGPSGSEQIGVLVSLYGGQSKGLPAGHQPSLVQTKAG